MRAFGPVLVVLVALGASSCDEAAPPDVALGQEFTLAVGEAVGVDDDALPVGFERVVEDSRCPSDVVCIQAGRVVVQLTAGRGDPQLEPGQAADADGRRVRLLRVEPYPSSAAPIEPSRYRATLVVERG